MQTKKNSDLKTDLSSQQKEAFDLALAWFENPDSPFVLRGYAGTGKTFCVQRIIKALQQKVKIAVCAPTHKAVHVLRRMAEEFNLNNIHITTLHSLLHVMPGDYDAEGRQQLKANLWSREPFYIDFGLVVVDEASMVDTQLLDLITSKNIPTLFMGDPAQLPPITEPESPVFQMAAGYELTQVMRYEGAIAEYVTAIRQDLQAQFPPRPKTEGNLTKCQKEEWEDRLVLAFQNADEEDSFAVRALTWTNNRTTAINSLVRARVMGVGDEEPYLDGERLVAKEPIFLSPGDEYINTENKLVRVESRDKFIFMQSCAECSVYDIKESTAVAYKSTSSRREVFDCFYLQVESDLGLKTIITLLHPNSWEQGKKFVSEWKKEILDLSDLNARKESWKAFYGFLERFNLVAGRSLLNRLQYAYAQTIHQSQGGTFSEVFLDMASVFGCKDVKLRNQLLYVGASRASKHLYLLSKF